MNRCVVDACVGIKWFFDEELKKEADSLVDQAEGGKIKIIVPGIFYSEFTNVLWRKTVEETVDIGTAQKILGRLLALPFEKFPDEELCDAAFDNALLFDISVYDALYLSLAEVYGATLVTADKALFQACKKTFDLIEFLGDVK